MNDVVTAIVGESGPRGMDAGVGRFVEPEDESDRRPGEPAEAEVEASGVNGPCRWGPLRSGSGFRS